MGELQSYQMLRVGELVNYLLALHERLLMVISIPAALLDLFCLLFGVIEFEDVRYIFPSSRHQGRYFSSRFVLVRLTRFFWCFSMESTLGLFPRMIDEPLAPFVL